MLHIEVHIITVYEYSEHKLQRFYKLTKGSAKISKETFLLILSHLGEVRDAQIRS